VRGEEDVSCVNESKGKKQICKQLKGKVSRGEILMTALSAFVWLAYRRLPAAIEGMHFGRTAMLSRPHQCKGSVCSTFSILTLTAIRRKLDQRN
jgi:hypothetical protein